MTHFDAELRIERAFAFAIDNAYREDYMLRNPPTTPISPEETLLQHPAGNVYVAFGDVSEGRVGYRNKHGGFCPNSVLPAKQSITGWLSPEGFIFACDHYGHGLLARAVVGALPPVEDEVAGDCERVLESRGWLRLRHSVPIWDDPNEKQAEVLLALLGA